MYACIHVYVCVCIWSGLVWFRLCQETALRRPQPSTPHSGTLKLKSHAQHGTMTVFSLAAATNPPQGETAFERRVSAGGIPSYRSHLEQLA